jgi:hypothetical protein
LRFRWLASSSQTVSPLLLYHISITASRATTSALEFVWKVRQDFKQYISFGKDSFSFFRHKYSLFGPVLNNFVVADGKTFF